MKNTDMAEIRNLLQNKFLNNTITLCFEGSIEMTFIISNLQFYISKTTLILSNGEETELKIDSYWINNVEIQNDCIMLYFERQFFN